MEICESTVVELMAKVDALTAERDALRAEVDRAEVALAAVKCDRDDAWEQVKKRKERSAEVEAVLVAREKTQIARTEQAEAALRELVRLKRIKDEPGVDPMTATLDEVLADNARREECRRAKPPAWAVAFAIVDGTTAAQPQPCHICKTTTDEHSGICSKGEQRRGCQECERLREWQIKAITPLWYIGGNYKPDQGIRDAAWALYEATNDEAKHKSALLRIPAASEANAEVTDA